MSPLLTSPLVDSVALAAHGTKIAAEVAKKVATSGRSIFDHSNSLIGSESEMTRACAHCSPLIAFQERCILVDEVKMICCCCVPLFDHRFVLFCIFDINLLLFLPHISQLPDQSRVV